MKKINKFLIMSLLIASGSVFAANPLQLPETKKSTNVNMAGFAVGYEFCQRVQQLAPILQAYSNVSWPIAGVPGFTFGMVQNESVMYKICNFIIMLETLDLENGIFQSARFLNELTGQKWDDHLNQADLLWNVGNSVIDFRGGGGFKEGALTSAHVHTQLVDAVDRTAKYYQKQRGVENPEGIEDKYERRQKLDKIAQLSYQRAILAEASACPDNQPEREGVKLDKNNLATAGKNNQDLWYQNVTKKKAEIREYEDAIATYVEMLRKMGPDFISEVSVLQEYVSLLEGLIGSFTLFPEERFTEIERVVPTGKEKKDGDGAELKVIKQKKPYQHVIVKSNPQLFSNFLEKFEKKWSDFIKGQFWSSGTFGLLTDKKGIIESKYRSYAWECSETKITRDRGWDKNDADYTKNLLKATNECRDRLKVRQVDNENLLKTYVQKLQNDLSRAKALQASIYTFESKFTGVMPLQWITKDEKSKTQKTLAFVQAPQKDCRPEFTPAEMAKLALELEKTNGEIAQETLIAQATQDLKKSEKDTQARIALEQRAKEAKSGLEMLESSDTGNAGTLHVNPSSIKKGL